MRTADARNAGRQRIKSMPGTIGLEHSDVYAKIATTNIRSMERRENTRKKYAARRSRLIIRE
jgi:hypothetical protein